VSEDGKRLFAGLRVSLATANALAGAVETLARRASAAGVAVRWVPPPLYHVTLRFFGWTTVEAVSALRDALAEAVVGVEPFSFSTARLGAFPEPGRARVIWAGVGSEPLEHLAARVEAATCKLGFAAAPGPFRGHVTLGRLREPAAVHETLLPLMEQVFSDTRVSGLTLLESVFKSGSLEYREVAQLGFSAVETGRKRQSLPLQLGPRDAAAAEGAVLEPETHETDDGWPRGHAP
jgi:2'-5' RNA ligase